MHQHWRYMTSFALGLYSCYRWYRTRVIKLKAAVASARKKKILMMNKQHE
jgi:hypothetical protein